MGRVQSIFPRPQFKIFSRDTVPLNNTAKNTEQKVKRNRKAVRKEKKSKENKVKTEGKNKQAVIKRDKAGKERKLGKYIYKKNRYHC